jgi:transposase
MRLYSEFDLHLSNRYLGIIEETGKRVFKKKLPNDPEVILDSLVPLKNNIVGIFVESTYNWYWLVDLLMETGQRIHTTRIVNDSRHCFVHLVTLGDASYPTFSLSCS